MKQTYDTGLSGENTACLYLQEKLHMTCLEKRWRSKSGEVDLIMADHKTIVFVEVKTRKTGTPGDGLNAVNYKKQKRIANSARMYLMINHLLNSPVRFDIVEVNPGGIIHIPNAFQPGGMFFH